jgi:type II secretion system protein L
MTLPVDHIYNLDRTITNRGEAFESVAGTDVLPMHLWVPSELIALHNIDTPTAPRRKWPELIPWMLEDRLLQPLDEVHLAVSDSPVEGQLAVWAVSCQDLREWQRVAENAGVSAQSMLPDYLALPWEPGRISIGWRDGVCVVRSGLYQGFAASPDVAWTMVDILIQQQDSPPRLSVSVPEADLIPQHLRELADINHAALEWQFAELPLQANLLTGAFKPKSSSGLVSWLPAVGLGILMIVLSAIYMQVASNTMQQQIADLESQLVSNYTRLFDGPRPAADGVRQQAEQRIETLFKQRDSLNSTSVASLLALDKLMKNCGCQLRTVRTKDNGLVMEIDNGAALKERNLNLSGYRVAIRQLPGGDDNAIELQLSANRGGSQ